MRLYQVVLMESRYLVLDHTQDGNVSSLWLPHDLHKGKSGIRRVSDIHHLEALVRLVDDLFPFLDIANLVDGVGGQKKVKTHEHLEGRKRLHTLELNSINMPKSMFLEPWISLMTEEEGADAESNDLPLVPFDAQTHRAGGGHDLVKYEDPGTGLQGRDQGSQDALDMRIRPVVQDPAEQIPVVTKGQRSAYIQMLEKDGGAKVGE